MSHLLHFIFSITENDRIISPNAEADEAVGPPSYDNLNHEENGTVQFSPDYKPSIKTSSNKEIPVCNNQR